MHQCISKVGEKFSLNCVFIIFSTKGSISEVDGLKKPAVKSRVLDQPKSPQKIANPKSVFRPIWLCLVLFTIGAAHGRVVKVVADHNDLLTTNEIAIRGNRYQNVFFSSH